MFFVEVLAERHKTNWNGGRERIAHLPAEETQSASLKQAQNKNSPRHNIHPVLQGEYYASGGNTVLKTSSK